MQRVLKVVQANPLFFVFLLPMATDLIVTLVGQGPKYWHDYSQVNEMSPGYFLLAIHPLAYVGGALLYLALCYWLVSRLKHPLNIMLAVGLAVGHTWGSYTWFNMWLNPPNSTFTISRSLPQWTLMIAYFVLIAICAGAALAQYMRVDQQKKAAQSQSGQPELLHSGISDHLGNSQA